MKRIWIRNTIAKKAQLFMTLLSLVLVLIAWILVTWVRPPRSLIPASDFTEKVLPKIGNQKEKEVITAVYLANADQSAFALKDGLPDSELILVGEILKMTGYVPRDIVPNPVFSPNVLPGPMAILKSIPRLIMGISEEQTGFQMEKSLFFAIWISLRRELIAFVLVILIALPLGVIMSCSQYMRRFFYPFLVVGSFIPIAALIPLTLAFFGIGEEQKVIFLGLGMFFVLLGLVIKEIDEVDDILLNTAYTLGFSQFRTILFVIVPTALSRIWKHLSAVFGLGWGYIIFAEMINTGGGDSVNGIGWLFIARQRRFKVDEMYAIFFVIIFFAFLFSYLFKVLGRVIFRHEKESFK
jgi:NitT/TauT family transport system permease protein